MDSGSRPTAAASASLAGVGTQLRRIRSLNYRQPIIDVTSLLADRGISVEPDGAWCGSRDRRGLGDGACRCNSKGLEQRRAGRQTRGTTVAIPADLHERTPVSCVLRAAAPAGPVRAGGLTGRRDEKERCAPRTWRTVNSAGSRTSKRSGRARPGSAPGRKLRRPTRRCGEDRPRSGRDEPELPEDAREAVAQGRGDRVRERA